MGNNGHARFRCITWLCRDTRAHLSRRSLWKFEDYEEVRATVAFVADMTVEHITIVVVRFHTQRGQATIYSYNWWQQRIGRERRSFRWQRVDSFITSFNWNHSSRSYEIDRESQSSAHGQLSSVRGSVHEAAYGYYRPYNNSSNTFYYRRGMRHPFTDSSYDTQVRTFWIPFVVRPAHRNWRMRNLLNDLS